MTRRGPASLALAALVTAGAGAGCTSTIEADEFNVDLCAAPMLEGLSPSAPVDGIELRTRGKPYEALGALCGGADREACVVALAAAGADDPARGIAVGEDVQTVVYSRGREAFVARSIEEVVALLGEVDTPAEARLVARLRGYAPVCRLRFAPSGFEAYASESGRCGERTAVVVAVDRGGVVTEVDRAAVDGTGSCR